LNKSSFALPFVASLALAALCAWAFGMALSGTYPEGIAVFAPPAGNSSALHVGLAMGSFFSGLVYAAMTVCAFMLKRLYSTALQHMVLPLGSAAVLCLLATAALLLLAA
jgi:hypothetical protein